eukprot:PITA_28950
MSLLCFPVAVYMLSFLFIFSSSSAHSFHDDGHSLLSFKSAITSDPHGSMADWLPAHPFCNWSAITCSRRHVDRVVSLNLSSMSLYGTIAPSLANLTFLHMLDLSNNALHGHIPTQLGRLSRLRILWVDGNELTGSIPSDLHNCTNLVLLGLGYNNLTGSIPQELGSLTHLKELYMGANILTGNIPIFWSNISTLTHLEICINKLTGSLPTELGRLSSLQILYLYQNELSGPIPTSLSNISTLIDLEISKNKFTGSIPEELSLLTSLQYLSLFDNELSGTIPASLSNISTLTDLEINLNKLTGSIPTSLSNMVNLFLLNLWGNQLSGNIPNSIGNCTKLTALALNHNKLSGSVPVELGKLPLLERLRLHNNQLSSGSATTMPFLVALTNCSHLKQLTLDNNKLSGVLPFAIGKLSTNLSYLSLSKNMIEGTIPPSIGNLSRLSYLNLSENFLNGRIPSLRNLTNIERLCLENNKLEGNIPNDFQNLQHLGLLDISGNMLSGKVPNSLASLKQLRDLLLHHNQLSGNIPAILGNCTNLELLDLSHNRLTGSIPREIVALYNLHFYLNLSWNLLEGPLPMEIGKIAMAQAIDISANHLSGFIPPTLGSCVELLSLNLSRNSFQGSIPDLLGNLQNLMSLDLSSNFLSGTIPITLNKLKMLQYLNLSFNKFTGELPKGALFANQSIVMSFNGNPNLCGPKIFQLYACPTPRGHVTIVKQLNYPRISYQELHMATNGFSQANLLGTSSFGSIYKGTLKDGTFVAVKVYQLQNDQADKSFKAECSVLQKVRHRNLVKIISSCSNLHFKGLLFEFISKGSLEKHLYPDRDDNNGEDSCELGLKARLDIAIDVSYAMEYLHHDCFVQVVHCDLKPSNVLLDGDMLGHVTDFGISRLIGESSTSSLTSTLCLRGSVGYIAPEYGLGGTVSTQGDVYSYGILLLEMLTRKRPTSDIFDGNLNLHNWVKSTFQNRLKEVIDSVLFSELNGDEFEENNAYKCLISLLQVGLHCSKCSPEERPTMRDVVRMLESIREDLMENIVPSRGLRRSISNLLSSTSATSNDAPTLNEQSSTF